MNMRHPLTGGGMTVAFNDAVLMAELLSPENVPRLDDTKRVLEALKKFHWRRKDVTAVINILAQALYSLFAANGKSSFSGKAPVLILYRCESARFAAWMLQILPARRQLR
jgi:squalene monooxygenase